VRVFDVRTSHPVGKPLVHETEIAKISLSQVRLFIVVFVVAVQHVPSTRACSLVCGDSGSGSGSVLVRVLVRVLVLIVVTVRPQHALGLPNRLLVFVDANSDLFVTPVLKHNVVRLSVVAIACALRRRRVDVAVLLLLAGEAASNGRLVRVERHH
jgi:hypothetical protein